MRRTILFLAAVLVIPPAQALAQSNDAEQVDVGNGQHDSNSKFGLLGLLGLAGLLGLKRREPDIHVDARRDKQ